MFTTALLTFCTALTIRSSLTGIMAIITPFPTFG
jgi:hypothetical protein